MVPVRIRKQIVEGIFSSVLIYCLPVFGGCGKREINSLQILQNKAARLICNAGWRIPRKELFAKVGWMTVRQLVCYHTALCTYRILSTREPEYLYSIMSRMNRSNRIIVPHANLTLMQGSFCYRGATEWNALPEVIRSCQSTTTFKLLLKKWIQENVEQFE